MIDKAAIEQQLAELPLFQYDWITTSELVFSERVRYICQTQCPMYNTTWACPPAVGTVEECKARCLSYPEALMMTSITEVSDIANLEETLAPEGPTRAHPASTGHGLPRRAWRPAHFPPRPAPSVKNAPTRTHRAVTRTGCSPVWRARAFWSPTLPKSTVWIS